MKTDFKILITLVLINLFFSCNDIENNKIIGRYYLVAVDTKDNMTIGYEIDENGNTVDVVGETIFSIGNNDKYIIAKQHPSRNKNIVNYFIIPIYKDFTYSPEKGLIGPLSLNQFEAKRKELNISNLAFEKNINDFK
ncbi:hypothetical protein FLACOL_00457 [Flavobacterium columnare]|uniref:DUF3997 domain-containing protein n=2 Tax=Flavobacterium TaxID=237 RepID=A0ABW8PPF9_9FLAO|nr:DUF3997 domain-containing protein [Flavobacterium columnare]SPE76476.1 hypothetical protein FLACOL_00457 [Flavobacterium columnare]